METEPSSEVINYGPVDQRLWDAVDNLVVLDGSLAFRLKRAWHSVRELRAADLPSLTPAWLAEELQKLEALWEQYRLPHQIEEAVDGLTDAERTHHARDIVRWFAQLREEMHTEMKAP